MDSEGDSARGCPRRARGHHRRPRRLDRFQRPQRVGTQGTEADRDHDCGPIRLAFRAGGLADGSTHPIVSATGVEGSKKLCKRAIPAISRTIGRCRGNHLPRLLVRAANYREGRMRASFAEDLMGPVLIRSSVPFTHVSGVGLALCAFQCGEQAHEPDRPCQGDTDQGGRKITGRQHTRLSDLQRPVGVPPTTTAVVPPLRAFLRNPRPSEASMCSA